MFKKWHITGLNKVKNCIAAIVAAVLLMGIPVAAAKPENFADLQNKKNEWYYEEVSKAIELGLFSGQSESNFGVDEQITRAEFVMALSRLCDANIAGYSSNQFSDVRPEHWHYKAISWAYQEGLVNGASEHEFLPDNSVSRQEMSKMMANAIELIFQKKMSTEGAATFKDEASIANWALEYVKKCNVAGLFKGDNDGNFNPKQYAPRNQAASVFYRCYVMLQADEPINPADYSLTVSGFDLNFNVNNDYYLVQPKNFDNCKILGYTGFTSLTVSVEQYASYDPYGKSAYRLGDALKLGNGRAKVTLKATLKNGIEKEYLIALADPDAADYAYARARVTGTVDMRAEPNTGSAILASFVNNARVYYLKTEGEWCMVEQLYTGKIGYIHQDYLRWEWLETTMPARYQSAIEALQAAHPNWTFTFVDTEMTYAAALGKYGSANAQYIDPLNYLAEDKIFAMLDIDTYDPALWNDEGIKAIWANESGFSKNQAVEYFNATANSILMNPYYIACRAALESGYGTSGYAKGMNVLSSVTIDGTKYENYSLGATYYNFYGIAAYDNNPNNCMIYAKNRNWNSTFRSIVEGANWIKDQYLDQGATTPYFFRYAGFQDKAYMSDVQAPLKEADILKRAYTNPNAKAHFIIPVYRDMPTA